jgi:hypothetical protein
MKSKKSNIKATEKGATGTPPPDDAGLESFKPDKFDFYKSYRDRDDAYYSTKFKDENDEVFETVNPKILSSIPAVEVARVAASFSGDLKAELRMRKAYQLLDMAVFVQSHLSSHDAPGNHCYNEALRWFKVSSKSNLINKHPLAPGFSDTQADLLPQYWRTMTPISLNSHRVELDMVMSRILGRAVPKKKRLERFTLFAREGSRGTYDMEEFKKKGVPLLDFQHLWLIYPDWWSRHLGSLKSHAGKTRKQGGGLGT